MTVVVRSIRPGFVAEIADIDLREPMDAADVAIVQDAIDQHPVLIFHGPPITNEQQIAFSDEAPAGRRDDRCVEPQRGQHRAGRR